jgi:hypothetical protein
MIDFVKLLTPEKQKEIAERDEYFRQKLIEFRSMTVDNFVCSAKYFMSQMQAPKKYKPGEPVYDSTFWYLIIPELFRRLDIKENTEDTS